MTRASVACKVQAAPLSCIPQALASDLCSTRGYNFWNIRSFPRFSQAISEIKAWVGHLGLPSKSLPIHYSLTTLHFHPIQPETWSINGIVKCSIIHIKSILILFSLVIHLSHLNFLTRKFKMGLQSNVRRTYNNKNAIRTLRAFKCILMLRVKNVAGIV